MQDSLGDKVRLLHILDAIIEIEKYTKEIEFKTFQSSSIILFASIKQLEIIGEACNHVSENIKLKFENINWRQIIGLRNIFVHEYFGIDIIIVWNIIKNNLPDLKTNIISILESLDS